jgi:hypothetical protein
MEPGSDRSERLCAVILTYLESLESGTPLDRASLLAANTDLSADLGEFIDMSASLEQTAAPLRRVVQLLSERPASAESPDDASSPEKRVRRDRSHRSFFGRRPQRRDRTRSSKD